MARKSLSYLPKVVPYLRPYWPQVAVSFVLIFLTAAAGLLEPWPLSILIDSVLQDKPLPGPVQPILGGLSRIPLLVAVVLGGFGITLLTNSLGVVQQYVHTKIDQRMVLDFRSDLFQHVQRLSLTFHDRSRAGQLMYRINNQASKLGTVTMAVPPLLQNLMTLAGMFFIAYRIDHGLALLSVSVAPFLYYSVNYYMNHIETRLREVKGMEGRSLTIVHEAMSMLRVIVAFGRESYEYRRFREQGESAVEARVKLTLRQTLFSLLVTMTTAFGTALVLGYGAYRVLQGDLTVGQLLVVMAYIASIYGPLQSISGTVTALQDDMVGLRMAFELLEHQPEIVDSPDAVEINRCEGRVTFENVSFRYPKRGETLVDIDFEAPPGRVVAIVGPTGAGKSTLVSLIPRFYDPHAGRVLLDGIDLRKIKVVSLREQISIVLQEPLLFSGRIDDNIRYGRLGASEQEVVAAAEAAGAHEFIERLPQKYHTTIGERGATLSGGERQRISIARAFLKDAPILILDEPTSSVDSKTEQKILEALERLMVGRTTFLIAHRLSTLRQADRIVVIDRGRVVEVGTEVELLARGGLYAQLHEVQMGTAEAGEAEVLNAAAEKATEEVT
jgi:ATP-binding cassette subfamily B protein/subfamily B ATP-binding cassette protein MsbA